MQRIWWFVTLLLVGLLLGLSFAHVLEKPAKLAYDGALYLTLQQTLYLHWGPGYFGGFLEPAAIIATLMLAVLVRRSGWIFKLTSGAVVALLLALLGIFFGLVEPVNVAFRAATPATLPADWQALRTQWELGHTLRFILHFFAFGALLMSVIFEPVFSKRVKSASKLGTTP